MRCLPTLDRGDSEPPGTPKLTTLYTHPQMINVNRDETQHLKLRRALRELKVDALARQALVDLAVGVEPVVDTTPLLLIEDALEDLAAVFLGAGALADDLDGVDEIGEDGVVDRGEGARAWSLLCLRCAAAVAALGAGQDAARGDDQHVAVGELLLELAGEAGVLSVWSCMA